MEIVPLPHINASQSRQAASLLVAAFRHAPSAWKTVRDAKAEIEGFRDNPERIAFAALIDRRVAGWIGALRHTPQSWELHPLAVDPAYQGRGIGLALVEALEAAARSQGIISIWLGSDDDFGGTTIYGADLYPNVLAKLAAIKPAGRHPCFFYARLGYAVVGVLPDVNGFGKPDILMAKRISAS
jgi:aminoglycoside 6'-N-acetyltransferase I